MNRYCLAASLFLSIGALTNRVASENTVLSDCVRGQNNQRLQMLVSLHSLF